MMVMRSAAGRRQFGVVASCAEALVAAQAAIALPWWATIGCCTVGARVALTPCVVVARRTGRRLAVAAPHLRLRRRCQ